jgi:hypothetical protein
MPRAGRARAGHARAACSQCHAEVAGRTAAGHAGCAQCHAGATHAPASAPPACETCHREQRASAPLGHRACAQCHEPHAGSVRPQATCGSCHARERDAGHGARMACAACHRPHGPGGVAAPPACGQWAPGPVSQHTSARRLVAEIAPSYGCAPYLRVLAARLSVFSAESLDSQEPGSHVTRWPPACKTARWQAHRLHDS